MPLHQDDILEARVPALHFLMHAALHMPIEHFGACGFGEAGSAQHLRGVDVRVCLAPHDGDAAHGEFVDAHSRVRGCADPRHLSFVESPIHAKQMHCPNVHGAPPVAWIQVRWAKTGRAQRVRVHAVRRRVRGAGVLVGPHVAVCAVPTADPQLPHRLCRLAQPALSVQLAPGRPLQPAWRHPDKAAAISSCSCYVFCVYRLVAVCSSLLSNPGSVL